jgi:hypothetical protein
MTRIKRLGIFALLILLALAALYFGVQAVLEHYTDKVNAQWEIVQKERLAIAINLFHSRYHKWPCADGPIEADAFMELAGLGDATINTEHIDFFKKADASSLTLDLNLRPLFFKTDDATGTCTVYSETEP